MVDYFTLNPHPNVRAQWKELDYLPDSIKVPKIESQAFAVMGVGKVINLATPPTPEYQLCVKTTEDPQRPITRKIHKVYRIKNEDKESFFFVQRLDGENFTGDKKVDVSQTVGKYIEQEPTFTRDRNTGAKTFTGHKDGLAKYEIPYTTGKFTDPSTGEQTSLEELGRFLAQKVWFYVYVSGKKYELVGVTYPQFISSSYDDLVYYAVHNAWPDTKSKKGNVA